MKLFYLHPILGGHDVWLETAKSYAHQLMSNGYPQRAAVYFLACHEVHQALDCFIKSGMYR